MPEAILAALSVMAVAVALLGLARGALLGVLARRHAHTPPVPLVDPPPPVSVIVPAFNEAVVIEQTVRALAASTYPLLEIVVVDDGSTDDTADVVQRLGLACVRVIRQANTGKAGALNTAIAGARHDIIVSVDADTAFQPDTVAILVAALAVPGVGAVAGNTKVANCDGWLGRWQHIEYIIGFNLDRRLYDVLSCMPTVPGAVGAFRRAALEDVGPFSNDTLAEDTDITIALGRAGWRVVYEAHAIAHTEAPATVRGLWRQRVRWTRGTLQSVSKHRAALRPGGRAAIGRRGLPYLLVYHVVVALLAPSIDVLAVYGLLTQDAVLTCWLTAYNALALLLAAYAFRLDGEALRPLWALPVQQFAHRQLACLVVARSALSALLGTQTVWHRSERAAEARSPQPGEPSAIEISE
jgi:cellulose synthase/poly-beta-1,6-N-acetylglucosamine synthase-like glycosyltransferase